MNWKSFNILRVDGLANMLLVVVFFLLIIRYSWVKSYYVCDLTGCQKIVVRVFCLPVRTTKLETEISRWLDMRLGPTKNRKWNRTGFQTVIGGPTCASKSIPLYIYQLYKNNPDEKDGYRDEMLATLQKARQTINKNTRGEESETED